MAKGKRTCKILKEIRRQIAEANDIEYVVEECQYKGDCLGTCPKCEAEVRYLEEQLHQRQLLGKAAMVAGISVGMFTLSSCNFNNTVQGEQPNKDTTCQAVPNQQEELDVDGMVKTGEVNPEDYPAGMKPKTHIKFYPPTIKGDVDERRRTAPVIKRMRPVEDTTCQAIPDQQEGKEVDSKVCPENSSVVEKNIKGDNEDE